MSGKRVIQGIGLAIALACAALLGKSIYDQVQEQKAAEQPEELPTKTSSVSVTISPIPGTVVTAVPTEETK